MGDGRRIHGLKRLLDCCWLLCHLHLLLLLLHQGGLSTRELRLSWHLPLLEALWLLHLNLSRGRLIELLLWLGHDGRTIDRLDWQEHILVELVSLGQLLKSFV